MVVLFAVLLTQHTSVSFRETPGAPARVGAALIVGGGVLGVLFGAVLSTRLDSPAERVPTVTAKEIGHQLMGPQTAALLVVGILLTVALLGAIVIASNDRADQGKDES